ncbi:LCP family protein [Catellatospora chokoriensis]|uniref:LCP family protein n=1 Tax=Catellatospora chokoriensis TaxID=310353 RepID=UPI001783B252|nr:LCP family protein [Catellatospora chokoriensis]
MGRQRRTAPRWARWSVLAGTALMLFAGTALVAVDRVVARYENAVHHADLFGDQGDGSDAPVPVRHDDVKGPLNILLAGIDPRNDDPFWIPRADSILVMHIPAGLDRGYLFSLPRDLLVTIPPFAKSGYGGNPSDKLAHAMFFGAQTPGSRRADNAQGFELLAATVSRYTGIARFDAGAIIDFSGFKDVIDALGGVDMVVDQRVASIHREPDGDPRDHGKSSTGYVGPQMVYEPGRRHFSGWQALDYARQRYIPGGDYARQRHQQQMVRAMLAKGFSADLLADPLRLDKVLRAAGSSLTFSGRGRSLVDWAFALSDLRPDQIAMVKLSGGGVGRWVEDKSKKADDKPDVKPSGPVDASPDPKKSEKPAKPKLKYEYLGEQLDAPARRFLASVAAGSVENFLALHPELLNK